MYAVYHVSVLPADERYTFDQSCSLFGCNVGFIPRLLRQQVPAGQPEPYRWHVPIRPALAQAGLDGRALVVDLKPNNRTPPFLTLFELEDVWGLSADGWTPIMMRLRALFVDENPNDRNPNDFIRSQLSTHEIVHAFMYLNGTVRDGQLEGRWTSPPASSTNSVLLWPEAWSYFAAQVNSAFAAKPPATRE